MCISGVPTHVLETWVYVGDLIGAMCNIGNTSKDSFACSSSIVPQGESYHLAWN
jgi:hypothetical protein